MWAQLEPYLPGLSPQRGGRWADHREVIEAIAWKYRTGSPWRDLPAEFGSWKGAYSRFRRWTLDGTWQLSSSIGCGWTVATSDRADGRSVRVTVWRPLPPGLHDRLMSGVNLRAVRREDLPLLIVDAAADPIDTFGFVATNALERAFAADGLLGYDSGILVVEDADGAVAGKVSWLPVPHGPNPPSHALNVGIRLRPDFRGRGIGGPAQALLADYLFDTTTFERLQAETDVRNVAEQRALEKAGFQREGIARHTQFRKGTWHDMVVYSRLRGDPSRALSPSSG